MTATTQQPQPKGPGLTTRYRREHSIWTGMRQRCRNPKCREYRHYGGRGIRVCRRWSGKRGFRHFLADLGPQPFPRASVHRVDNDGPYAPANVVWADPRTQARHMRTNRILTYRGRTMILVEWAEEKRMKPGTLGARLAKGWPLEKALEQPVGPSHGGGRKKK